ncbi:MAG TPA: hypothetical protein VMU84_15285 [Thermoanaerobaculia bacterium]|nr:hypothetical protein [Thermoanaerobaculia bacterium]
MNKVLVGLIAGAVLGAVDGASAWFTPAVRAQILFIIAASTVKGIIGGVAAGWFARKVQSVPAGIAFGFAVGLVLAFLVAMQPEPDGTHYWIEIMLPGSVLGGVVGWATQRYGRPASRSAQTAVVTMLVLALVGVNANAADGITAAQAFEKMKALDGTWSGHIMTPDGPVATVSYRVTAGGSTVMETMFAGQPHEMITMYVFDGKTIEATHYCVAQNQPVMRFNAEKSSANELVFDFVRVTGKAGEHMHDARIRFGENGRVETNWESSEKSSPTKKFFLARAQ